MHNSIILFQKNMSQVRDLTTIYTSLNALSPGIDLSDILRSQLIMAVSALDYFVHVAIEEGMLEIYNKVRTQTDSFEKFCISLKNVQVAISSTQIHWLRGEIKDKTSHQSYQHPEKIADGIRLISNKALWNDVSTEMGMPAQDIKLKLTLIHDRRNKIVHNADEDILNPGNKQDITQPEVVKHIDFIESVVNAIFKVIQ